MLVEDDMDLAGGLIKALRREGFTVNHVALGKQAILSVRSEPPDLLVLDLGLPDITGLQVLESVRSLKLALPVLILTARDGLDDKVMALDSGADDYLSKPFEMEELLARLRVLARRLGTSMHSKIELHGVLLDTRHHEVAVAGQPINLSRREYMLLMALMENAGRVQTKEMLEQKLYGWGEEVVSNAIEVHVSNLRKKMPADLIKTVRGVGYTISKTRA
nr:response regulator transcription factor [Aestuariicella hydrocarbonica]